MCRLPVTLPERQCRKLKLRGRYLRQRTLNHWCMYETWTLSLAEVDAALVCRVPVALAEKLLLRCRTLNYGEGIRDMTTGPSPLINRAITHGGAGMAIKQSKVQSPTHASLLLQS